MGHLFKLPKEVIDFLEQGNKVISPEGCFIQYPHWFKYTEEEGIFEVLTYEELPVDLKKFIEGNSDTAVVIDTTEKKDMLNWPHKQLGLEFEEEEL